MNIILASSSPRRKEILKLMNLNFDIIPSVIDEEIKNELLENNVFNLSKSKCIDVFERTNGDRTIIAADTIVVFQKQVLGKPGTSQNAYNMLQKLQGNICVAHTGIFVLVQKGNMIKEYSRTSLCEIKLNKISKEEIEKYIKTGEPLDKAGGFAIQGIGSKFINYTKGDFYSGIGLSITDLYSIFKEMEEDFNIEILN